VTESSGRDGGNRAFQSNIVDGHGHEGLHGCRNLSMHTGPLYCANKYMIIDSNINQNTISLSHGDADPIPLTRQQTLKRAAFIFQERQFVFQLLRERPKPLKA
jgi:hypothetical protein